MSIRAYLIGLSISTILCVVALVLTIVNTNPVQGGQTALASLYISGFFAGLGILTLTGYVIRRYLTHNEIRYGNVQASFRQAFLLSGLLLATLYLQSLRLVSWWDLLLLITIVFLLELYLRANARSAHLR